MARRAGPGARLGAVGRALYAVCTGLAVMGGLVLAAITVMTCVSIVGRLLEPALDGVLDVGPIPGDFELVEIGCALAVFAFLPYCQLTRGNVIVDFFTARMSVRRRAVLDAVGSALFLVIAGLVTWRGVLGGLDLKRYGETTMILAVPVWWGFVPAVLCSAVLTVVCAYTLGRSLREVATGLPADDLRLEPR